MSEIEKSARRITVGRLKEKLNRLPDDCELVFSTAGGEAFLQEFKLQLCDEDTLEPKLVSVSLKSATG